MITPIIITIAIIIITIFFFLFHKKPEAYAKLNFTDFKENNYYDKISLTLEKNKKPKILKIIKNCAIFDIYGFKNRTILNVELNLINSTNQSSKSCKIKIYKNYTNIINIKINNINQIYYNSEIIFYCEDSAVDINLDNLEYCSHNSKNRKRLIICNFNEVEFSKIIKDNSNNDIDLQNKALNIIKSHNNQLLLINVYIRRDKLNILIFKDEEQSLITPTKDEKKFFENFYLDIYKNIYDLDKLTEICEDYKKNLLGKNYIFKKKIENLDDINDTNIYFSFINQGINCLLENEIISENSFNDYYFIIGYMLFYFYIYKKILQPTFVQKFFKNMNEGFIRQYPPIDLIRIGVSYIIFAINDINSLELKFTGELNNNSKYYKGFKFYKDIILDLNEDSDLIFIYLQINSGCGLDLIKQERCFKLSMISVEDIKSHIIENIPKYFYTYFSDNEKYFATDSRTQVMIFNESKIFDYTSKNKRNNNTMNITIGLFHESGHSKYHSNSDIGGTRSPINCINKKFEFIKKYHYENKQRGEAGKFVDYFLYNSTNDLIAIDLIGSLRSNELMEKDDFIGNLSVLNEKAKKIVSENPKNDDKNSNENVKNTNNNNLHIITNLSSEFQKSFRNDSEFKRLDEIGCDIDY